MVLERKFALLLVLAVLLTVSLGPDAAAAADTRTPSQKPASIFESSTQHVMSDLAEGVQLGTARLFSWAHPKLAGSNSSSSRKLRGVNKIQASCNPRYSKWC
jgi:hypothetical protein